MGREATSGTALAPGFRFHPTDEELVSYYLKRKVCAKPFRFDAIAEVDIYKSEPWELPCKSRLKSRDQEWYFFSALDKKYGNGARMNRATGNGYWKATGKDRTVCHDNRLFGMKKTLVFHSGRAPDGKRTDWVMHEYRLVEEQLEKAGATQESYVLCRVFQKSGLGPPNGNRYAPFIEEEWEDDRKTLVPGEEPVEATVPGDESYLQKNEAQQDKKDEPPYSSKELPGETQNDVAVCKSERVDNDGPELCVVNREAPFPILQYKRRRQNDLDSNGSDNSTRAAQDHTSSATAATTTTTTIKPIDVPPATTAVELSSSMEAVKPNPEGAKEVEPAAAALLPGCCMKYINKLQNEIHKSSIQKETLKLEMMSAQAMINALQARIEMLSNENADLMTFIRARKHIYNI